jgi:HEAT repeat protein
LLTSYAKKCGESRKGADMSPDEMLEALEKIESRTESTLKFVLDAVNHDDAEVRFRAVEKIGEIFEDTELPDSFVAAIKLAMKDADELVRSTSLEVMQCYPAAVSMADVLPYLLDESSLVRGEAAILLGEIQNEGAIGPIHAAIKTAQDPEKAAMYFGLFLLADNGALEGLISLLKSPDYLARCAAANLLPCCASAVNEETIKTALESAATQESSRATASAIREALEELRG